jgi:hypothetical protein
VQVYPKTGKNSSYVKIESLREWILDTKNATLMASSENLNEMCAFVRKIGTNPVMENKSVTVSFCPPSEFAFAHKTGADFAHPLMPLARLRAPEFSDHFLICALDRNRTYI